MEQKREDSVVKIENVTFKRGDKVIFDDLSLELKKGKVNVILGPSGTGKTTLLRLITGQIKPQEGNVIVKGLDIPNLSTKELLEYRKSIGMLFQSGALFTNLNIEDNVAFPLREHTRLPKELINQLVMMKLNAVGLRCARGLMPQQLSGGMARRAALARTIALDPDLILYDEPFTGQDPISLGVLCRLAKNLNDALGATSVIVSHDIDECLQIADYIFVIYNGKIVAKGSAQELRNSEEDIVKQFICGLPDGPISYHYSGPSYKEDILGGEEE